MLTIAKIFGKSPFVPLQSHMKKVNDCIQLLPSLFEALQKADMEKIEEIAKQISKLEHEADLTKNDIRNHLPKSLFLPIDRGTFLEILSLQDSLADQAEDIAVLATIKKLPPLKGMEKDFEEFWKKNIISFDLAYTVVKEFDKLVESSFGGAEAAKVKELIEKLAYEEHQLDILQNKLMKQLYNFEKFDSYSTFSLWDCILKETGALSNLSEKLGHRIRMVLELK